MWLFGYGSLVWKVDFPYNRKIVGYIKGYVRRFYQYSSDHRGTEEKPGRVVTLLPSSDPEEQVWGIAYEILDDENGAVWSHLDFREKNGYKREVITFYPSDKLEKPFELVVYIGDQDNNWFAGEAPINDIASNIVPCKGISGHNLEYLCQLAESMRQIAPHIYDHHLFSLEKEALRIISNH